MHFVGSVKYLDGYRLRLEFEDGIEKIVDLASHLDGEVFEPLKDIEYFKTVQINPEIDTIGWDNEADFSPDFLFEIGEIPKWIFQIFEFFWNKGSFLWNEKQVITGMNFSKKSKRLRLNIFPIC